MMSKLIPGVNDFKTWCEQNGRMDLLLEWDYEKNQNAIDGHGVDISKPTGVTRASGQNVWWKCPNGHSYKMAICNRTLKGSGCTVCSNHVIVRGENDLFTTNPELADEWDWDENNKIGLSPYDVHFGSPKYANWKCMYGHRWKAPMTSRCRLHTGCPICDKQNHTSFAEQSVYYYINKYFPDAVNGDIEAIGMELDVYIPSVKVAVEYDGSYWHDKFVAREKKKNNLCNRSNIKLIRIRENGLHDYDDCICIYRDDLSSLISLDNVIKSVLLILGVINPHVDVELDRDTIYAQYKTVMQANSLAKCYPEIAVQWDYEKNGTITPDKVSKATNDSYWWICDTCGQSYYSSVGSRTSLKTNCPYCCNKTIIEGFNDLATLRPDIASEWNYIKNTNLVTNSGKDIDSPTKVSVGSGLKVWWKCHVCGYEWKAAIGSRTGNGRGCPVCGRIKAAKSRRKKVVCLETGTIYANVDLAHEAHADIRGCSVCRIVACCGGHCDTAGGYHWKYIDD